MHRNRIVGRTQGGGKDGVRTGDLSRINLYVVDACIVVAARFATFFVFVHEEGDTARVMAFERNREGLIGGTRRSNCLNRSESSSRIIHIGHNTHLERGGIRSCATSSGLEGDSGQIQVNVHFGKNGIDVTV